MCGRFDLKEDAVIGMLGIGYHRWLEIGGTGEFSLTWMLPELTEAWGNNIETSTLRAPWRALGLIFFI